METALEGKKLLEETESELNGLPSELKGMLGEIVRVVQNQPDRPWNWETQKEIEEKLKKLISDLESGFSMFPTSGLASHSSTEGGSHFLAEARKHRIMHQVDEMLNIAEKMLLGVKKLVVSREI